MPDVLDRLKAAIADRYTIEREIGAGGMATVYLAEDLRHHRKVAIKVLRPDLAATLGPERFLREIEVAARLQHPHILPLLDSGEADDFLYYVMPYIEGQSLRDKLAKEGELPIGDAVRILRDVVDALTEAHANGVVHRDIKPENILLRGRHALVTDFGVAKAVSEATGREQLTTAGVALGTPAYMAPEQASADPHVDHRVDIYAVGAVAYELLTGRPVFMGTTPQMVLSAHVTEAPQPVTKHRDTVPAALEQLVLRCLEKKPADRWQSAEELLPQLEAMTTPSGGITPMDTRPVAATPAQKRWLVPATVGGVAVIMAVVVLLSLNLLRPPPVSITLSNIGPVTRAAELELYPALSPDGGDVVYSAGTGLDLHLYVQDVGGGRALPLTAERPGHQGVLQWAADGRSIIFYDAGPEGNSLQRVPRLGGPVQQLMAFGSRPRSAAYREGQLAFVVGDSLFIRDLEGGAPAFAVRVGSQSHSLAWSPNGSLLAYVDGNPDFVVPGRWGNVAPSTVWTVPVTGGDPVRVTSDTSLNVSPVWTPDGEHLLFISDRDGPRGLYAVQLDDAGRPRGEPIRVEAGLEAHSLSLSADGRTLAYSRLTFRSNIVRIALPAIGPISITEVEPVTVGNQTVENHDVSHDGRWLAYDSDLEGNQDIYLMPLDGGEPRRLTGNEADDFAPNFSPDGGEIVFYSNRYGSRDIFLMSLDGGNETRLTDDAVEEYHPKFSPDGLHISFGRYSQGTEELFVMSRAVIGGAWSAPRFLAEGGLLGVWSPGGERMILSSPVTSQMWLITLDGQEQEPVEVGALVGAWGPTWSPDGSFIRFEGVTADGATGLYEVPAEGGPVRLLVRFDDPTRMSGNLWHSVGPGDMLYLTLKEYESDIYVADLEIK
ncbi:MAG: protein kinase [Gemmatimonadales bacterium]